jgi:hypothetical protein
LDRFAEVNTCVEPRGDELCASLLRRGDVEDDVRESTGKWHQLGCEHHRGRQRRHQQTHASGRPLAQPDDLIEDGFNFAERGTQVTDELFTSLRRRHAACGAREEANAEALF